MDLTATFLGELQSCAVLIPHFCPRTTAHPQTTCTADSWFALLLRTSQQNVGAERQYSLEDDVALAKALQHYLLYLEALSHATGTSAHHRREHEKPPAKVSLHLLWPSLLSDWGVQVVHDCAAFTCSPGSQMGGNAGRGCARVRAVHAPWC